MAAPSTLRLVDPTPESNPFGPSSVVLPDEDNPNVTLKDGVLRIEHPDGSATIDFNPAMGTEGQAESRDFYRNLADEIDSATLAAIASELLTGIEYDEQSRKEWLDTRARGIALLGLKLAEPRGDVGTTAAPLEGMASVHHPLLLEATIRFQANARGELLPTAGPVKVRNDATPKPESQQPPFSATPPPPGMGDNGGPPLNAPGESLDELGSALEKDMNHYLTVTATEYVPDTDRMLFYIGFGGDGFKKVYNCPLRRRPVSESVDAENIIVSNAATDIRNCGRVTHKIKMRPAILRRMQIIGAYRDVSLTPPIVGPAPDAVEQKKMEIDGRRLPQRTEDADYNMFECYCELDIAKFAPKQFKDKGLPLPYVVTLEKESRQILAVKRNWAEDDAQALAKQFFVQFPFIRGLGFYGIGLIHLLGNVAMTLTAIWREFIDSGMFANFPGFLYAKGAGRQLTNQIRVPPGGGQPMEVPPGMRIQDAIMPLPYKEPGPAFTGFVQHVEEVGQRLGQTAEINIGEGKQEVPVGTIMALIEQSTKIMDSVHKRLHAAQAEEFALLKERFREDPEAFWRHNKKPARQWEIDEFKQALEQRELVPVADPNNPTSLHRMTKAAALLTLAQSYQQFFNVPAVLKRLLRVAGIDVEGLLNTAPTPPPPDPRMAAIVAKAQAQASIAQIQQFQAFLKAKQMQVDASDKAEDRVSRERIEQMKLALEQMRVEQERIIHANDIARANAEAQSGMHIDRVQAAGQMIMDQAQHEQSLRHDAQQHVAQVVTDAAHAKNQMQVEQMREQRQLAVERMKHDQASEHMQDKHDIATQQMRDKHELATQHAKEKHAADLEHKKALARAAARAKPKTGDS